MKNLKSILILSICLLWGQLLKAQVDSSFLDSMKLFDGQEVIEHLISKSGPETRFVPGHGPLSTLDDLKEYRDLLVSVRDQVSICIKDGLDMDETISSIKIDPGKAGIGMELTVQHMYRMAQKHK